MNRTFTAAIAVALPLFMLASAHGAFVTIDPERDALKAYMVGQYGSDYDPTLPVTLTHGRVDNLATTATILDNALDIYVDYLLANGAEQCAEPQLRTTDADAPGQMDGIVCFHEKGWKVTYVDHETMTPGATCPQVEPLPQDMESVNVQGHQVPNDPDDVGVLISTVSLHSTFENARYNPPRFYKAPSSLQHFPVALPTGDQSPGTEYRYGDGSSTGNPGHAFFALHANYTWLDQELSTGTLFQDSFQWTYIHCYVEDYEFGAVHNHSIAGPLVTTDTF